MSSNNSTCFLPTDVLHGSGFVLISVLGFVIMAVGTIANILIIIAFIKVKSLCTPSNVLLANMAVGDLLFNCVGFPCFIIPDYITYLHCDLFFMIFRYCIFVFSIMLSFYNVLLIGIERFIAIEFPYKYGLTVDMKFSFRLIAGNFVFTLIVGMVGGILRVDPVRQSAYLRVVMAFNGLVAIFTTLIYIRIYSVSRMHLNRDKKFGIVNQKSKAITSVMIACCYAFSWAPPIAVGIAKTTNANTGQWGRLGFIFMQLGTCCNAGIYTYRMAEFRNAVKTIFWRKRTTPVIPSNKVTA